MNPQEPSDAPGLGFVRSRYKPNKGKTKMNWVDSAIVGLAIGLFYSQLVIITGVLRRIAKALEQHTYD